MATSDLDLKLDYYYTPRLAVDTKPMGFPKGRSGSFPPIDLPLSRPRGPNPVVDIT